MVLEHSSKTKKFKIENLVEVGPHVFFTDTLGSKSKLNPLTGSWFRIEKGPPATPPPYEYDEIGIVVEGSITLEDETGQKVNVTSGDTFIVYQGSTVTFSTTDYGIAWKCSARLPGKL